MCHCFGKDNSMLLVLGWYFGVFGVAFSCCLNGPFLGHIGLVYLCRGCLSPPLCELLKDGLKCPGGSSDCALLPIDLWLKVI
jgi:hypothetical protein